MAQARPLARPRRGEVYLVSFDPTVGAEIQKTRPAVILQNNIANRWSPITIVAAITSRFDDRASFDHGELPKAMWRVRVQVKRYQDRPVDCN